MKESGLALGVNNLVRALTVGLLACSLAACSATGQAPSIRSLGDGSEPVSQASDQAIRASQTTKTQTAPQNAIAAASELPPQTAGFPTPTIPEIPAYAPREFYKDFFTRDRLAEKRDQAWRDAAEAEAGREGPVRIPGRETVFDSLLMTAFVQVGTDYRSGGTDPDRGFDCSGFTSWVFEQVGVNLPRSSGEQFTVGKAIHKGELKKGDLVFFRRKKRISHVGIYVKNGSFIHSPRPGSAVKVSNLAEPAWSKQYAGARRVLHQ